jgi:hypothetical protein
MKALRLPACTCLLPYLFGRRSHAPSFVRVRRGALDGCGGHSSSLGQFIVRRPVLPACCRRGHKQDLSGFLAIHPCLCLAPRPRPSRQDLTAHGLVGAAPGLSKPKAPACNRSRGSLTRLWHLLSTLHERRCRSHARLASGWRAAPFPGGCRTLWITSEGFWLHFRPPSQAFA